MQVETETHDLIDRPDTLLPADIKDAIRRWDRGESFASLAMRDCAEPDEEYLVQLVYIELAREVSGVLLSCNHDVRRMQLATALFGIFDSHLELIGIDGERKKAIAKSAVTLYEVFSKLGYLDAYNVMVGKRFIEVVRQ